MLQKQREMRDVNMDCTEFCEKGVKEDSMQEVTLRTVKSSQVFTG